MKIARTLAPTAAPVGIADVVWSSRRFVPRDAVVRSRRTRDRAVPRRLQRVSRLERKGSTDDRPARTACHPVGAASRDSGVHMLLRTRGRASRGPGARAGRRQSVDVRFRRGVVATRARVTGHLVWCRRICSGFRATYLDCARWPDLTSSSSKTPRRRLEWPAATVRPWEPPVMSPCSAWAEARTSLRAAVGSSRPVRASSRIAVEKQDAHLPGAGVARAIRVWIELAVMSLFIHPRLDRLPAGLPFLGLGETVYEPDFRDDATGRYRCWCIASVALTPGARQSRPRCLCRQLGEGARPVVKSIARGPASFPIGMPTAATPLGVVEACLKRWLR